jgi:hypothetical protein
VRNDVDFITKMSFRMSVSPQSKKAHGRQRQPGAADVQAGACARLDKLRVTLEARVAELTADLTTLEAAIRAMRQRYPEVVVGAYREDLSRAREGTP